jgi:hypothetical protein
LAVDDGDLFMVRTADGFYDLWFVCDVVVMICKFSATGITAPLGSGQHFASPFAF